MSTYVIGDIHGAYKALKQCLERCNFDYENDTLIQLGDIVDGWEDVYECVEELTKIKKLICIKGNHDDWFVDWMTIGQHPVSWLQGGLGTLHSYCKHAFSEPEDGYVPRMDGYTSKLTTIDIPNHHKKLFKSQKLYHIDYKNRCFVHGGFDRFNHVDYTANFTPYDFYWNRELWSKAMSCKGDQKLQTVDDFSKIFIGHTATINYDQSAKPMYSGGVWNLDQGAGFFGKLTIMNVDTEEYWQSDWVQELYKDAKIKR